MRNVIKRMIPVWAIDAVRRGAREVQAACSTRMTAQQVRQQREQLLCADAAAVAVGNVSPEWRVRIDEVIACPDNAMIDRVADAGRIDGNFITMHNGIRVAALGYYGDGMLNMLLENKGVHEPQEEYAFGEVLKHLPRNPTMLELGSYWGFYSLWLKSEFAGARCFLVEPSPVALESGRVNFETNGLDADFTQAFAGKSDEHALFATPTTCVDTLCRRKHISELQVLHADVQGAEHDVLTGARQMLSRGRIHFVFISTHSNDLHYSCMTTLKHWDFEILASHDLTQTYAVDGLIVAKHKSIPLPERLSLSSRADDQLSVTSTAKSPILGCH